MAYIYRELLEDFTLQNNSFDCEFGFQLALAMYLKEKYPKQLNIEFEKNIYPTKKARCDIVASDINTNEPIFYLELKFVMSDTESAKTSYSSRISFIKDIKRLQALSCLQNVEKYCIFLTNKKAVYENDEEAKGYAGYFNAHYANSNNNKWFNVGWKNNNDRNKNTKAYIEDMKNIDNIPDEEELL